MSPYPRCFRLLDPSRLQQYCCLVVSALSIGGQGWMCLRPVLAASVVTIENQATGSYLNESTETQTTQTVVSDTVTLTVAEVAGITISLGGVTGATISGGLAYFDFVITNVGNDPTQFFIPGTPATIAGGTQSGNITITSYDSDGNGPAAATSLNVSVPTTGGRTGVGTGTLLGADAAANNGSIPPGGTIRIRVPIQISAASGNIVSVTMGNTTPANGQNQPYVAGTGNKDVYTVDNPNGTPGEIDGAPVGEREASITESLTVTPTSPNPSLAGARFDCDPFFYMLRNDGSSNSQLYKIDRQSSPYGQSLATSSSFSPSVNLNALGYNPKDGYFYAMQSNVDYNVIYRIGRTNAVPLGVVTNLLLPSSSFLNGTFDDQGNYYIRQLNTNKFYKIAIFGNTATATVLDTSGAISSGDIAFNPVDRKIYAANQSSNSIAVSRIEDLVNTSAATTININLPASAPNISGSIGAIFFDSIGTLYAYASGSANSTFFYQMPNVASGSSTVSQVSSAIASSSTDGASCPFLPPRIDVVKSVGTVNRINATTFDVPFSIKVGNTGSGSTPNVQVTENLALAFSTSTPLISLPTAPTITSTPTSGLCTLNSTFNGKTPGSLQLLTGGNTLPGGASCTIALTARLVYGTAGSVPTTQNNSVYASTTAGINTGHTFSGDNTPIFPPDLYDVDTSTNGSNLPSSVHADIPIPTPITFPVSSNPSVLLVKRITAINNQNITTYSQEDSNPYDDNLLEPNLAPNPPSYPTADTTKWPNTTGKTSSTFLVGAIGGTVKPQDSIEYTIYFLSAGNSTANNVLLCDRVPANVTFIPNAFNNTTPDPNGLAGADRGIAIDIGGTLRSYTSTADGDIARYFPPSIEPSTVYGTSVNCGGANTNGAVVVNLGNRPSATGTLAVDSAAGAYGSVRFRGLVK